MLLVINIYNIILQLPGVQEYSKIASIYTANTVIPICL